MADRWNDERDRAWRAQRTERYDRGDAYGADSYERRDYALGDYDTDYRSFQPRDRDDRQGRDRGPVFGERETGTDYAAPRHGRDDYRGDDRGGFYRGEFSAAAGGRSYPDYRNSPYGEDRGERAYRHAYGAEPRDRDHREDARDGRSFWDRASERVASWFGEYDDDRRETRDAGHRGRGPQGYKRSDERINDEAHERLTDDPWVDASNISISVSGGEVTLSGTVNEREAKHRAERIVERLSGVNHVQNNLRIDRGNLLTGSGRGFGDSASEALMRDRGTAPAAETDLTLNPGAKGVTRTQ